LEKLLEAWACFKPILACFRVVFPVESVKLDFYDQYKALVLYVTSHIAWECAYMYKYTIYDTKRFKAVITMNLSELRS
jgi:hypothetical protein